MSKDPIVSSEDVREALLHNKPVVALESTIITHGMPYPQNLETARKVEAKVRDFGAVPATIAVIEGQLFAGLSHGQLEQLARAENVMKLSRADLAFAVSAGRTGSTTVAATMIAARAAGIDVFATGGIGGVHRGASQSFDISADLAELAKTGVVVVCAGAKAILDIEKTLEVLETQGVPVVGFDTATFPAFWSRESAYRAPLTLHSPAAIADFARTRSALSLSGGILIANPVPAEHDLPATTVENWIETALGDAERHGITGKAVTPYLLQRMFELSDGKTLETNIALVLNNAALAAQIAAEIATQRERR